MTDNWNGILGMVDDGTSTSIKTHKFVPQGNDEIWYTSSDGNVVTPYTVAFGSGITVVSNTYTGGKGIIKLSGSATTFGKDVFNNRTKLTSVTIPNTVTTIDAGAFDSCTSLTSLTLPESVTTIGNEAFQSCSELTSLTIPSNVTSIGNNGFRYCNKLHLTFLPTTPTLGNNNSIPGVYYIIYVPAASVDAYKTANIWSQYASRIRAIQS